MFTGLIEEIGTLKKITSSSQFGRFQIQAKKVLEGVQLGDSIAVNGGCLTVVDFDRNSFSVETMAETLKLTKIGLLKLGDSVHLERALLPTTRLGGHFVSGHIDGLGTLEGIKPDGPAKILRFSAPEGLLDQMVPKGSIAIDGVSLTLIDVDAIGFTVGLIPHTQDHVLLTQLSSGDKVNLETDMLAKYCQKMLFKNSTKKEMFLSDLASYGF